MSEPYQISMTRRMRRQRSSAGIRALLRENQVTTDDLIAPLFVKEGEAPAEPVGSMPNVFRYSIPDLVKECTTLAGLGIRAVALFPCTPQELKNEKATEALNENSLILRAVRALKKELPELILITDVALDPYTSHGHDGLLSEDGTRVDNDSTVAILAQMAVLQAQAGVDWVAPSDMMDGRVDVMRHSLDAAGFTDTVIMAYSAKFNSAYYGPFRDAIGSQAAAGKTYLDKSTYQLSPANTREAILDALLDDEEGADILMVKPAGPYLDIISKLKEETMLPLAAYQVSGEYAQIHAASQKGWLDYERVRDESLLAIKRAGADMILTYFAKEMAEKAK
ncbi:porphobilinogen synthase [Verrucomicrobia bacterium]|nr:porphobilinogen synthase [Verrucomicrobiota bacterium]